jgi:hypothetical protein
MPCSEQLSSSSSSSTLGKTTKATAGNKFTACYQK